MNHTDMGAPAKSARERGYTWRWQKARAHFLRNNPACRMCQAAGRLNPASVVDHIVPHRGDPALFWDVANWQPLCKLHHDASKQRQEKRGTVQGCDASGAPLDADHPWHRGG